MSKEERAKGFYWVKNSNDKWIIAKWTGRDGWLICGVNYFYPDAHFEEINPNRIWDYKD